MSRRVNIIIEVPEDKSLEKIYDEICKRIWPNPEPRDELVSAIWIEEREHATP
jgi:hypothetical protein